MGQIDLETDAALAQLNFEELAKTPGGEFAEIIGDLLAFVGSGGPLAIAGKASNLVIKIRKLAGASYASNLIYAITAVRNDLRTLFESRAELRERIESLPNDPKFAEAISALALRAMHTSVKDRLKRMARIVVNGVKENDLEPENLDDMMRFAVELTARDILELGALCAQQSHILAEAERSQMQWHAKVREVWQQRIIGNGISFREGRVSYFDQIGSLSKFAAFGFAFAIAPRGTSNSPEEVPYALLPEGKKFYERLQEIATEAG